MVMMKHNTNTRQQFVTHVGVITYNVNDDDDEDMQRISVTNV